MAELSQPLHDRAARAPGLQRYESTTVLALCSTEIRFHHRNLDMKHLCKFKTIKGPSGLIICNVESLHTPEDFTRTLQRLSRLWLIMGPSSMCVVLLYIIEAIIIYIKYIYIMYKICSYLLLIVAQEELGSCSSWLRKTLIKFLDSRGQIPGQGHRDPDWSSPVRLDFILASRVHVFYHTV